MARRKFDGLVEMIEAMAAAWDRIMERLDARFRGIARRDAA